MDCIAAVTFGLALLALALVLIFNSGCEKVRS